MTLYSLPTWFLLCVAWSQVAIVLFAGLPLIITIRRKK